MKRTELSNAIIARLREFGTEERREKAKTYSPTKMEVIGVPIPDLRNVLKEFSRELKQLSVAESIALAKELIAAKIFEAQHYGIEIVSKNKKVMQALTLKDVIELQGTLDNWGSVDAYSVLIAGIKWREGVVPDEVIFDWLKSDNRWLRRAAVVCTIALNQKAHGGTGDAVKTLEVCVNVVDDHDDMVVKALSWALRELAKQTPEPVRIFIDEYKDKLHRRVLREVRQELETGKKN